MTQVEPLQIICDTREQQPYAFTGYDAVVTRAKLDTGDYSLTGYEALVAVERKSLDDLVNCITKGRERFERELARCAAMDCFTIVIETDVETVQAHRYRSKVDPHAVIQSVLAFQVRYRCPFVWAGSRDGGEYMAFWTLQKWLRECERSVTLSTNSIAVNDDRVDAHFTIQ